MSPTLNSTWAEGAGNGSLRLVLDYGDAPRRNGDSLCVMTQLFPLSAAAAVGATLQRAEGCFHAFDLSSGDEPVVTIDLRDLAFAPRHSGEGPRSAYLQREDGSRLPISVAAMLRDPSLPSNPPDKAELRPPSGPFCVPWPNHVDVAGSAPAPVLSFADVGSFMPAARRMADALNIALAQDAGSGVQPVQLYSNATLSPESYGLSFHVDRIVIEAGPGGEVPAIATLLQLVFGTRKGFGFPAPGSEIKDQPAFRWRGFHLDCARHFFSVEAIEHLLSLMAVLKLNRFHWHLTDDEAWRPEITALPELTEIGSIRAPGSPIPPQFADGLEPHQGTYSRRDMARVVETAQSLGIEVMPEIDLPGHSTALLKAMPHLADPNEGPDSYRSVQNFANNSLNPAAPGAVEIVETILDDLLDVFPTSTIHLGGDELPAGAWETSPLAQSAAARKTLGSVRELQRAFFGRLQDYLHDSGHTLAVWDEQGRARNIGKDALVFCWQDPEVAADLVHAGYPVVICPAQACYLDIAQSGDWFASGSGWAGIVSLEDSYGFDPLAGIAPEHHSRVAGVQACLWTETVATPADFETMVFPRLFAVAETAWTDLEQKDFQRFAGMAAHLETALSKDVPSVADRLDTDAGLNHPQP